VISNASDPTDRVESQPTERKSRLARLTHAQVYRPKRLAP